MSKNLNPTIRAYRFRINHCINKNNIRGQKSAYQCSKNILTIFLPASPNTNIKRIPSTKLSPNAKPTPFQYLG